MMDESARLHAFQQQLEKEMNEKITFFGQSVNGTIKTCLLNGLLKKADKIKSDFKVPDKRCVSLCTKSSDGDAHFAGTGSGT